MIAPTAMDVCGERWRGRVTLRRQGGRLRWILLRVAVAMPFLALALFFAIRSLEPIRLSFTSATRADPRGFFLTVAAIGLSLAALFCAAGFAVVSHRFRLYGGFLVVSTAAVAASLLPQLVFRWTVARYALPWVHFAQDGFVYLGFGQRTLREGLVIQEDLAVTAVASAGAQVIFWRHRRRSR
jgi:hypothetical protein